MDSPKNTTTPFELSLLALKSCLEVRFYVLKSQENLRCLVIESKLSKMLSSLLHKTTPHLSLDLFNLSFQGTNFAEVCWNGISYGFQRKTLSSDKLLLSHFH